MSEPRTGEKLVRPRQATLAGWMIVIGSVAVVLTVFAQLSTLNSLETTETLERALSQPPAQGLGISVETARELLRVAGMVAAACAAAAAVLGWFALQRSAQSRLALAVLAVPLFVTGVASGGLLSSVVAASVVMLWMQPSRDWFAGRVPASPAPAARVVAPPPVPPRATTAPPPPGYVAPPGSPAHVAPTPPFATVASRPAQLVWACVITWVAAGVTAGLMAISVVILLAAPDATLDEVLRQNPELAEEGITTATVRTIAVVSSAVILVWCLIAAGLAALTWRATSWAHVVLVVSAGLAGAVCLFASLVNPLLVVPLAACVASVVLLLRAETRGWLRAAAQRRDLRP